MRPSSNASTVSAPTPPVRPMGTIVLTKRMKSADDISAFLVSRPVSLYSGAKVAAASLDNVATQAAKAGMKAAGVVIDDAAVTPRYVVGFAAQRELPIVGKIAAGSLRNKVLILLPGALALSYFLPGAITPPVDAWRSLSVLRGHGKSL